MITGDTREMIDAHIRDLIKVKEYRIDGEFMGFKFHVDPHLPENVTRVESGGNWVVVIHDEGEK